MVLFWVVGLIEDEDNVDEINDVVCWLVGFIEDEVNVDDDASVVKAVEYDVVNDNVVECCVDDNPVDVYAVVYVVVDNAVEVNESDDEYVVVDKENVVEYDVADDIAEVVADVVVDIVVDVVDGGRVATMPTSIEY